MPNCANGSDAMIELALGGVVTAFLFVYLIWALVRPEDM